MTCSSFRWIGGGGSSPQMSTHSSTPLWNGNSKPWRRRGSSFDCSSRILKHLSYYLSSSTLPSIVPCKCLCENKYQAYIVLNVPNYILLNLLWHSLSLREPVICSPLDGRPCSHFMERYCNWLVSSLRVATVISFSCWRVQNFNTPQRD